MIKSNTELTNNRLDKISAEVVKIARSLEFTQNELDEELKSDKIRNNGVNRRTS